MSWGDLPRELVIEILSWLRVKTLIRFRCVCKSWYATISHPSFITTHLNRASVRYDAYLQDDLGPTRIRIPEWCLLSEKRPYADHVEIEIPFKDPKSPYPVVFVGSVNGLVCISESRFSDAIVHLWNPSIRKLKTLPSSSTASQFSRYEGNAIFGFGFHRQTDDYKVIRVVYFRSKPDLVEVYTLSTDSWRKIEKDVPCLSLDRKSNAFINGSVHWIGLSNTIMSFDIGDEVFGEIKLPNYSNPGVLSVESKLGVLKESLSLLVGSKNGCFNIWVMREYGVVESWTKQFTFVVPQKVDSALGFTKNNELLLVMSKRHLNYYDFESLQLKNHRIPVMTCPQKVVPFKETLVLLQGRNAEKYQLGQENSFYGVREESYATTGGKD